MKRYRALVSAIRRKNPLSGFIFTDGGVVSCTRTGPELMLEFRDYCDGLVRFDFVGVSELVISDDILSYEVMHSSCVDVPNGWCLSLLCDDREPLLACTFTGVKFAWKNTGKAE